jgi:hypothetical protein
MEKNQIRKEIAELINSIKQHSDEIDIGDKKHIPQLELELILKKIASLYEKSIVFNYLNSQKSIENEIAKLIEPKINIEERIISEISKAQDKAKEEPKVEEKVIVPEIIEAKPQEVVVEKTIEVVPVIEKPIIEEKPLVAEKPKPIINIQKPAISDIKTAIGINDRFQFANDLFEGNMQEYEIGIQQLNSSENIDSAMIYFHSLQKLYTWDLENDTVKRLLELVERRYS